MDGQAYESDSNNRSGGDCTLYYLWLGTYTDAAVTSDKINIDFKTHCNDFIDRRVLNN